VRNRDARLREHSDGPGADPGVVRDTLLSLARLNAGLLRTHALAIGALAPVLRPGASIGVLDLGCGAGDLGRAVAREGARRGCRVDVLGVDLSPEAVALARSRAAPGDGTAYEQGDALGPGFDPAGFDVVLSSFLLHHLPDEEAVRGLLRRGARARAGFVHLDLVRSRTAWALFGALGRPLVERRETWEDGLASIRRSWTAREMEGIAAGAGVGARVEVRFPWRLRVSRLSSTP
jgi:2-polyprenyl-3-methyl-5-hydroxy-6-metoxy-1,4-benzoquinol methylase